MKHLFTFFIVFFAFLCIGFKAECLNTVTGYDDVNKPSWVYYDATDILNQTYGSYDTNTFPYFIEFSLIRSDITPGDRNYIEIFRLAFREEITFTFTNGTYQFYIPNSTFYFCGVQFYNSNTWERSYNPSIINQNNFPYGVFSSAYVSSGNVPFTYNGNTVEPPPDYIDDLYITKDGNSIKFGAYATINSRFENTYFYTDAYTAEFTIERNGSFYTVSPSSYEYYNIGLSTNITQSDGDSKYLYQDIPYMVYYKYMRSVKVSKYEYPSDNPPTPESLLRVGVTFSSENVVTLNTLLTEFQKQLSEFTVQDMQTQIVVKIKNSKGVVALEKAINFSPLAGTQPVTELPPDETGTPNQFDPYKELNDNLSSNNYYLQSLLYGDTYLSQGMSDILQYNKDDLNPFDVPDFELVNPDFDADTMSWFRRVVSWWYDTPFGFIAVAALTFIIIRVIVW